MAHTRRRRILPLVALLVARTAATGWNLPAPQIIRGGGLFSDTPPEADNNSNATTVVEDYVQAMQEKDAREQKPDADDAPAEDDSSNPKDDDVTSSSSSSPSAPTTEADEEVAAVGVKSHSSPHKKSNAVGDPDDDDDDDDDGLSSDFSEEWEASQEDYGSSPFMLDTSMEVNVELVDDQDATQTAEFPGDEDELMLQSDDETDDEEGSRGSTVNRRRSGGVGIRLGGRRKGSRASKLGRQAESDEMEQEKLGMEEDESNILQAWMPHVYLPPSSARLEYLAEHARSFDAQSKARLDRRTLYSGLLMEWKGGVAQRNDSNATKASSLGQQGSTTAIRRPFLPQSLTHQLLSALSLATQPQWRKASPIKVPTGIALYPDAEGGGESMTLSMQETVAMALAHSMGCGFVILDDDILGSVRHYMLQKQTNTTASNEGDLKPAALIQSLLKLSNSGKIATANYEERGRISMCMHRDLAVGLDDPFDDRACDSVLDMRTWEDMEGTPTAKGTPSDAMPLVLFVRTGSARSLWKSKTAMELLIKECTSPETVNLIVLGKGIDAKTKTLPPAPSSNSLSSGPVGGWGKRMISDGASHDMGQQHVEGVSPQDWLAAWEKSHASGRHDPPGSRRFNIFLYRGKDGVWGSVAPPEAGYLFPYLLALQAKSDIQKRIAELEKQEFGEGEMMALMEQMERCEDWLEHNAPSNAASSVTTPQYFNASLSPRPDADSGPQDGSTPVTPSPEVLHSTIQKALIDLLDQWADHEQQLGRGRSEQDAEHAALAHFLRHGPLRRAILDNLANAMPALSDPKCQGMTLSIFFPPRAESQGKGSGSSSLGIGNWFHKVLTNQEAEHSASANQKDADTVDKTIEEKEAAHRQKRVRTLAAAAAVAAAHGNQVPTSDNGGSKAVRNLAKLESICRHIALPSPTDPVRAKTWESWIDRERGSVVFRQNRRMMHRCLTSRNLKLQTHTGTRGAGSALRQMLSVRNLTPDEWEAILQCAIELEAAKSLRQHESSSTMHEREENLAEDVSLSQLIVEDNSTVDSATGVGSGVQYVHPSSLESALSLTCGIRPSAAGLALAGDATTAAHRSKDELAALAQDKHERALLSQVAFPQDIGVTYDMIGGLAEVKELLRQSITYPLKYPHLYSEGIAREAVKGVLLFGPPGTGKTMLAKAVATEGGASFLSVDASSIENKWLGESEKNARAVFTLARRLAPCVIFIDEVDSLLSSREGSSDDSAHGTLTSVKTTMMSEWDGLHSGTNGVGGGSDRVVVIGSTNRPFDLDEAVLRRFPRRILVDLPDLETRAEILEVTLAENRLDPKVNLTEIAERLEGYTGSDIKEVCREAVVQISHEQARLLDTGFQNQVEDVTEGSLQRLRPVTEEDFERSLSKLKRSVSEMGRELERVWEWNSEYGEIKKRKANNIPHLMNMYL